MSYVYQKNYILNKEQDTAIKRVFFKREEQSSHISATVCGASLVMMEITRSGREASRQRFASKHTRA